MKARVAALLAELTVATIITIATLSPEERTLYMARALQFSAKLTRAAAEGCGRYTIWAEALASKAVANG